MCQQPGCTCSDPRILNRRTLAFWRALAQSRGETADRVIPYERTRTAHAVLTATFRVK